MRETKTQYLFKKGTLKILETVAYLEKKIALYKI